MKIVIIGAGIVGASLAYHLSGKGADVEVIEAVRPGYGTSTSTFAYLNAVRFSGRYAMLRLRALRYWHELAGRLGARDIVHGDGSIFYTNNEADAAQLEKHLAASSEAGLRYERWTAKRLMTDLEPDLIFPETDYPIVRMPEEGRLEPAPMIGLLLRAAQDLGVKVSSGERVLNIEHTPTTVRVLTSGRILDADQALVCNGPDSKALLDQIGVSLPINTQPGVTLVTRPLPVRLRHVVYAGQVHFKPEGGGRILAGRTDYRKEIPSAAEAQSYAQETALLVKPWIRNFGENEVETVRVGVRPIPGDGLPIVGRIPQMPNLSIAVMHSGISLSGLVGKLLAGEIIDGNDNPDLADYRPQRFLDGAVQLRDEFAPWGPGDQVRASPPKNDATATGHV
ncbi:NAD(P)/FAD-dependent oxidoreductase [Mesorhizobium sp. B4-1-4]|uniref:NAD(P)/FAD-dependent oxidoreductase n=1 Tax=Mesorhizobium sp. B4-1-4 TaxID=2589888 RepID=UPI0015E38FA5|nr:FAD-dependent oxidoreductase [Mesorhizobium sp. B4-1-4]UCI32022.1 FAD-binding oxidoreductase [Mesorhizobium sp. B4-1-4]